MLRQYATPDSQLVRPCDFVRSWLHRGAFHESIRADSTLRSAYRVNCSYLVVLGRRLPIPASWENGEGELVIVDIGGRHGECQDRGNDTYVRIEVRER